MRRPYVLCLVAMAVMLVPSFATAATVSIVDNMADSFFDVFYSPTGSVAEFTNWDLVVIPTAGGLLDPSRSAKSDDVTNGAAMDTFANTVFSSLGFGAASYIHTAYIPGTPPFVPGSPLPTVGGTPDRLSWSIFDTESGDTGAFGPYHMARVMYTQGGAGTIQAKFFDTSNAGVGETFGGMYGIPEPTTISLAGLSLLGLALRRRS